MKIKTTGLIVPLLFTVALAGCEKQPETAANAITVAGFTSHLKTLASDEYGGRAPGTPGETLTVNYIIDAFKTAGLQPANGAKYTQAVPLTSVEVTNQPGLTFSGVDGKNMQLAYREQQVIWTRKQIEQTTVSNSQLVFVGYGINAPERDWNDYAGIDVNGKTVVMLVNDPGFATQNPDLFNGNAMTYYGRWDYKFDEAARQGAAAAIIIHDTKPAAYPWSTVSASWTGPQFDLVRPNKGADLSNVEGWIGKQEARTLFRNAGLDLSVMYAAAAKPGFKAVTLNVTASASIKNKLTNIDSQNVVAMIKGTESPEDVFIFMAHWDHLGIDPTKTGDNIYNGALDNATGAAGLLELAKAYAALPEAPKRTVMFLATTAEEQGLLGSAYYAKNPIFPLANTIAGLNMDGLNHIGPAKDVTLISKGNSELDAYLVKRAREQKRVVVADPKPEKGSFYRSDHFELSKKGVPMLYAKPGYDNRENGLEYGLQQTVDYVKANYHRPTDEYDPSWDLTGAVEDLKLYFLTGHDIINSKDWPKWLKGTEFRAVRDAQMAGKK